MSPGFLGRHLPLHGRGSPQSPPDLLTLGLSYKEEDGNACSFSRGPWRMGWMTPRLFYELWSGDHLHRPRSHRWNLCPPLTLWTRRWYFPWSRSIGDKAFLLKTSSMRNTRSVVTIRWCAFSRPHICHLHSYDVGVKFSSKGKKNQKECVILCRVCNYIVLSWGNFVKNLHTFGCKKSSLKIHWCKKNWQIWGMAFRNHPKEPNQNQREGAAHVMWPLSLA